MPKYEITAPDGRKFIVEGPEGSTQEEALAKVQASYQPKAATKQPEPDYNPTSGMSGTDKFLAGAGKALTDVVRGVGQVVGMVPQSSIDETKARDKALMETGAGTAGNIAGSVAALLPSALIPGAGTLAGATAIGAAQGALAPVASDESRLQNATMGAVGGAGGTLAARGLARAAQPIVQSEAVRKLVSEGVVPTPGQAAGPRSIINRVEQQLTSMGPLGWIIQSARDRSVKEMDLAAIRKAIPAGESPAGMKAGQEAIEKVGDMLDNAYSSAYASIKGKISYDSTFTDAIKAIPKAEGVDLPPSLEARFSQLVKDRVISRIEDGATAETIRDAHNSLGALARKYRASGDPDQRALGRAFAEAKDSFREMVSRQSSGDFKAAMDSLDKNYSALKVVEKAAGYQGAREGVFSSPMLNRASKNGSAEMRDFARSANDVLGNTVPDSGTAGRFFWPYLAGGGLGAANESMGGPGWLTAAALAPVMYSRAGARYMIGDLLPGQAAAASALRAAAPYTSILGMGLAGQSSGR